MMAAGQTRDKLAIHGTSCCLRSCKQPAGWRVLLSVFSPSLASFCLSLQNAVGAEGRGTDVTGSRPHPFSTLLVLIGGRRVVATAQLAPSLPSPLHRLRATCEEGLLEEGLFEELKEDMTAKVETVWWKCVTGREVGCCSNVTGLLEERSNVQKK